MLSVVLHTCVERLLSINKFLTAFRRLALEVKCTIKLIFFFLFIFHIAIVHSNMIKPVLDIYEYKNSPK